MNLKPPNSFIYFYMTMQYLISDDIFFRGIYKYYRSHKIAINIYCTNRYVYSNNDLREHCHVSMLTRGHRTTVHPFLIMKSNRLQGLMFCGFIIFTLLIPAIHPTESIFFSNDVSTVRELQDHPQHSLIMNIYKGNDKYL